jgi:hypothetical protein
MGIVITSRILLPRRRVTFARTTRPSQSCLPYACRIARDGRLIRSDMLQPVHKAQASQKDKDNHNA